jgi:TRAP-type transport system periplasmic protein
MKNLYRVVFFVLIFTLVTGLAFAAGAQETQKVYNFKVGHVFAATHPWQINLEGFAKDVREATNGAVQIEAFPAAQLGGDRDVAEGLRLGTIEMGLFGTGALQSIDKRMIIEELPYAWATREQAYAAMDGELGKALDGVMANYGIVGLAYWESGYRHITNNSRPINSVSDLRGLALRVPEAEMRIDTFRQLGALPTPLAFGELFTALQQGVVSGQENPLATIYTSRFQEVQKYLSLSYHIWGSGYLAISDQAWKSLPANYQQIIKEKAAIWTEKCREDIRESDAEFLASLKAEGMLVNETNFKEFQTAVQPVWVKYEKEFGTDLMNLVRKYTGQ